MINRLSFAREYGQTVTMEKGECIIYCNNIASVLKDLDKSCGLFSIADHDYHGMLF
jgi:hypothetical protein